MSTITKRCWCSTRHPACANGIHKVAMKKTRHKPFRGWVKRIAYHRRYRQRFHETNANPRTREARNLKLQASTSPSSYGAPISISQVAVAGKAHWANTPGPPPKHRFRTRPFQPSRRSGVRFRTWRGASRMIFCLCSVNCVRCDPEVDSITNLASPLYSLPVDQYAREPLRFMYIKTSS